MLFQLALTYVNFFYRQNRYFRAGFYVTQKSGAFLNFLSVSLNLLGALSKDATVVAIVYTRNM